MLHPTDYFDLSKSSHSKIFEGVVYVWDALKKIPDYIVTNLQPGIHGTVDPKSKIDNQVYIGQGTIVEPGVIIKGPTILGANCTIRFGAYIRENVIIGDRVMVGHTTELKHCLLFDEASVPHFAYVGDSILGWKAHLGAGVKISNFKLNGELISVTIHGQRYETGLVKFGAIVGDEVEIGCNAVLNPGTIIGKRTLIYPSTFIRGYYPPDSIVKLHQQLIIVERK